MSEQVIEELKAVLVKHGPNFLTDGDGGIIHHDIKSGRIHMVEIRAFDVTGVAHADRPRLLEAGPSIPGYGQSVKRTDLPLAV